MSRRTHDRNVSGVSYNSPALQKLVVIAQATQNLSICNRHGAGAARVAHNHEVTRSKRVVGILQFSSFTEAIRRNTVTFKPLSWRAAYRRITPRQSRVRTFDGYLFLIKRQALDRDRRVVPTGMAQRKRAGLITPRTYDRNILPVFFT